MLSKLPHIALLDLPFLVEFLSLVYLWFSILNFLLFACNLYRDVRIHQPQRLRNLSSDLIQPFAQLRCIELPVLAADRQQLLACVRLVASFDECNWQQRNVPPFLAERTQRLDALVSVKRLVLPFMIPHEKRDVEPILDDPLLQLLKILL